MLRKKALVFFDHDLLIRHFIHSGIFKELDHDYDVTYVFNHDPDTDKRWIHADPYQLGLKRVHITNVPRGRMGSWYNLYVLTILHNQRGTLNYPGRILRIQENIGKLRTWRWRILSFPGIFGFIRDRMIRKQGIYQPLLDYLRQEKPDVIIHPSILTGYYINELLIISKNLNIPFIVLMNSWDNPSQKAVTTGYPDKLVVWGPQTRDHAISYMQMSEQDVLMFGAAQFQVYRHDLDENEAELRNLFEVPGHKPIILYAGVSKSINETRHLDLLEQAIESGAIADCHILYRPHPWRGGLINGEDSFFDRKFRHISIDPHMRAFYQRVVATNDDRLEMADYQVTAKLLRLVSGTISTLSTILLETLLHSKPVLSFMPKQDMASKYGKSAAISQRLAHFNGLWRKDGVLECHADEDLSKQVNKLLEQARDPEMTELIRRMAKEFVVMDGPGYGERLLSLANEMVSR